MNPSNGRFHTQDSYEGEKSDPISLHKYLYASANPVSGTDPSGNYTITQINATFAAYSPILTQASLQTVGVKASLATAAVGGLTLGQAAGATAFAVSLAAAIGSIALRMLKERADREGYEFITIYRHASRLNSNAFRITERDADGYLSTWDGVPAPAPRPGSKEPAKFNVPFLALFKKPVSDWDYGLLVAPYIPNVLVRKTPLDDWDPASHLHYSLVFNGQAMPHGNGNQGDIPDRLAAHANRLGLKRGELRDPYAGIR